MAWPTNLPRKDDRLSFFKNQLSKSVYWPEIQEMSANEQNPRLLGDFDFNGDGVDEIFLEWLIEQDGYDEEIHQYQIYQKKAAGEYALISEFELKGMPSSYVKFIKEPDPEQPHKVIFVIQGGSYWGTYYLLSRDGKSADELCTSAFDELVDLNNDGIYELVFGQWHNFDERLGYDFLNIRYLEVFQWNNGFSYQKIWPPEGWKYYSSGGSGYQVGGMLYDIDGDGKKEIVALTDTGEKGSKGRELSIYKLSDRNYTLISKIDLTHPYTAINILGVRKLRDRKQIVLQLEEFRSSEESEKSGHGKLVLEGYDFKDKNLKFVWLNEQIKVSFGRMSTSSASIVDTDGDGEEEMVFKTGKTDKPIVLKGEKEFSQ